MPPRGRRPKGRETPATPTTSRAWSWAGPVALAAVTMAAFILSFHKIDDFDTWWHLASGRWIAAHGSIPATDTLSHTVRDHAWVNLQWGFDLALYWLYARGGAWLLCLFGAALFTVTAGLLLRLVTMVAGAAMGALLVLLAILAAQERITLRPELASFLLLAAVLSVLEYGRRHEGRGLWLLVPLMIVWANVHALFVLGAFAIVCSLVGTPPSSSRRLWIWGAAALASVLINPFGVTGAFFPLTLVSRINGSNPAFRTIGEFASPFAADATGLPVIFYKVLMALAAIAALTAVASSFRRGRTGEAASHFDWGGLIFVIGLAVLSAAARRNVAIFAIGAAPVMARWVGGRLVRLAPVAAMLAIAGAVTVSAAAVTGASYRFDNTPVEFGAGVIDGTFPVRAAAFARAAALPPTLYNDMSSGGYLAWDDPVGGGVFVDGRLEVYDIAFVTEYVTAIADPARWQADADRYGVQTAIIFHRFENDRVLIGRLVATKQWTLVYGDEVAAIFVRTQGNEAAIQRAAARRAAADAQTAAWLARPAGRWPWPAGIVEGTRAYARFLATVGSLEPAVTAYRRLLAFGIASREEIDVRLLLLRYFLRRNRAAEAQEQARAVLVIDPGNLEAREALR